MNYFSIINLHLILQQHKIVFFSRKKMRAFQSTTFPLTQSLKNWAWCIIIVVKLVSLSISLSLSRKTSTVCLSVCPRVCLTSRTWTDKWTDKRTSLAQDTHLCSCNSQHARTHTHTLSFFILPPFTFLSLSLGKFHQHSKNRFCAVRFMLKFWNTT